MTEDRLYITELTDFFTQVRRDKAQAAGKDPATIPPYTESTVRGWVNQSYPGPKRKSRAVYVEHPIPKPQDVTVVGYRGTVWAWVPDNGETMEQLKARLIAWYDGPGRPGQGAGGGRPKKGKRPYTVKKGSTT